MSSGANDPSRVGENTLWSMGISSNSGLLKWWEACTCSENLCMGSFVNELFIEELTEIYRLSK